MQNNYPALILETESHLESIEASLSNQRVMPRLRMLRVLKSGQVKNLRSCALILGYSERQLMRWWDKYSDEGLEALLEERPRPGKPSQITDVVWNDLQTQIEAGTINRLEDARLYLREKWDINYQSLNGVWWMLRKHRTTFKKQRRSVDTVSG
jgi:putative transposase